MGFYGEQVLPRFIDVALGNRECARLRARVTADLEGEVLEVMRGFVLFELVRVALPAVRRVTLKVLAPPTRMALAGKVAFVSLELMPTVSTTLVSRFQLVSTALTVTLNTVPAVCEAAVPVLPLLDPAAAVSPGTKSCNLANAPALTEIEGLVLAVLVPSLMSLAVTVRLPAVLSVTLKVCVPATSAVFNGPAMLGSVEVMPTV